MPVARSTGWRIAAGTISAASLTSAYEVAALPIQSDQDFSIPWTLNSALCATPTPARVTTNADLSRSPDGFYAWKWGLDYMSFG
ncbi:hypothetical protein, partial [Streptococcus pneumoniae]|uniref:hypothetical protein n=1 Tax=Streptococcus pneumoniae TaxID=1313 RepID=UPI001E5E4910